MYAVQLKRGVGNGSPSAVLDACTSDLETACSRGAEGDESMDSQITGVNSPAKRLPDARPNALRHSKSELRLL